MLEKLAREKRSSLLRKSVNYGYKKFYSTGLRSDKWRGRERERERDTEREREKITTKKLRKVRIRIGMRGREK